MDQSGAEAGSFDWDVVVVGAGFGGAVSALRLTEKGYRVAVVESGRRYADDELPKTSWRLRKFLWAPKLGLRGIQRISFLRNFAVLSGVGVGGGSLVYANTLYRASEQAFEDPSWRGITDWKTELEPHYVTAERMLGVRVNPGGTLPDRLFAEAATEIGVADTFRLTPVGVFFGRAGERVSDPYFGGLGPDRTGCVLCGECMTGCRYGAKNRLDLNYLYLAEHAGARIFEETSVTDVRFISGGGYRLVTTTPAQPWCGTRVLTARQVVLAGGVLGTLELLMRSRRSGGLPELSARLGQLTRTNSQSLLTAETQKPDPGFTEGVAITSSIHPDAHTHVEPVRYGPGSNVMGFLCTLLTDGGPGGPRWWKFVRQAVRRPGDLFTLFWRRRWSERTTIMVVMQALDNSVTVRLRRGLFGSGLTAKPGHGGPVPTWIPTANELARRIATKVGGRPRGTWGELVGAPLTAHPIGGCVIGECAETGAIDPYHRVFGHPGLHVIDGSSVPANLGANPALTITALAERAVSMWPNAGEPDPRPAPDEPYRHVEPVLARNPVLSQETPVVKPGGEI
ncbi:GMC family oxidoreductase [Sciscionella marina]|uniref:GMC family oxidoreductase n=1 Tax=Sciscionella marina TaxID=508770 RepID=UPI000477AF61|nr:GMC family oxidoreductase [Sciscionella marina]